jgi:hypothetical protein
MSTIDLEERHEGRLEVGGHVAAIRWNAARWSPAFLSASRIAAKTENVLTEMVERSG